MAVPRFCVSEVDFRDVTFAFLALVLEAGHRRGIH